MSGPDECYGVLTAEQARHRDLHVCHNDGPGMTGYEPCPLYRAITHALFLMALEARP